MFANAQDVTLLQGALMSAANLLHSKGPIMLLSDTHPIRLKDKEGAVDVVSATILKMTKDTSKVKNGMEFLKMQLHLNRRLHSVMFYVALRSNDITCTEANKFYESIPHTFPSINWMFYLKLNYQCNWSEYFIECAKQLQPDILASVIKSLLPLFEKDARCNHLVHYTWHLSLQSITWKFFHLDNPPIMEPEQEFKFDFQFEDFSSTTPRTKEEVMYFESRPKSKLLHAFITILNHMMQSPKTELTFAKVVLHFYKTVFVLMRNAGDVSSGESVKELFRMNPLLEKCFRKDATSRSAIESGLRDPEGSLLSHCYANASWDISVGYLLWLVPIYWSDAEESVQNRRSNFVEYVQNHQSSAEESAQNFQSDSEESVQNHPSNAKESLLFLQQQLTSIPIDKAELINLHPQDDLRLLKAVVRYDYPYANRAAVVLMNYPDVRTTTEFINTLKERCSKYGADVMLKLVDVIVETDSSDIKNTFLDLFFHILSQASCNSYNMVLDYILKNYGYTEHFKLADFDSDLIQFARQFMTFEEAKTFLLPLFVQMPLTVLKLLIDQALIRGAEGLAVIPVLKHIPSVCYHGKDFSLLKELSHYFLIQDLPTHIEKNIVSLIESLMTVQTEKEIIYFDKFLDLCILPCFSKKIRIDLTLECLNVSLKILTDKSALNLSRDSFFSLMENLLFLLDECIELGNGKTKELVLLSLSILDENKEFNDILSEGPPQFIEQISHLKEVVAIYLKPFYKRETYECKYDRYDTVNRSVVLTGPSWIYCCQSDDPKLEFKKRLYFLRREYEYDTLLSILVPLLSHFTLKEWIQSAYFLKDYFKHFSCEHHVLSLLHKSDPLTYSVVRTLMDCYGVLLTIPSCDIQYVTSCFTNTVKNVLGEESHPQLCLNIFIDACHLTSISKTDSLQLLSSFLIDITKCMCVSCNDKVLQAKYMKLAQTALNFLPDCKEKTSVIQKFGS